MPSDPVLPDILPAAACRQAFEAASGCAMIRAADGRIAAVSDALVAAIGMARADLVGRGFSERFPSLASDGAGDPVAPLRRALAARDARRWQVSGTPLPEGMILLRAVAHDAPAQPEPRPAEQELDRIFDLSLDLLCISGGDGYFKRISPAVTRILGWAVDEFLAMPYLESIHPDDLDATRRAVEQQVLRGEPVYQFENRYRHRDGSWRLLSWTSMPQPGGLMYAVARDVTRQREAEAQILRLNAELGQRTRQLEANNRELEAFSYSVSHDLRAPLRRIDGFAYALLSEHAEALGADGRGLLDSVIRNAQRMGLLIDALLNFAKLARQDLRCAPCDLGALARDAFDGIDPELRAHVARFDVADLPVVAGDPALLGQVWINLVDNAVKFTRKRSGAEIRIAAQVDDGVATCRIADNGAGFDPRFAGKLFGIFERLHDQQEFEGTGIGLSLVQRIVQRHGGRVWAESEPGGGSTFSFTLPLVRSAEAG